MGYRFALILAAALNVSALPLPALAQQAGVAGDPAKEQPGITGAPDPAKAGPAKTPRHHRRRSVEPKGTAATDVTRNGTTGAAASVAKPPSKVDPQVHNLNTALPP